MRVTELYFQVTCGRLQLLLDVQQYLAKTSQSSLEDVTRHMFCSRFEAVNLIEGRLRQFLRPSSETCAYCGDKRSVAGTIESWALCLLLTCLSW